MLASLRAVRQEVRDVRRDLGDVRTELRDEMQAGFKELTARVVNIGDRLSKVEGVIEGMFWSTRNQPPDKTASRCGLAARPQMPESSQSPAEARDRAGDCVRPPRRRYHSGQGGAGLRPDDRSPYPGRPAP